MIAIRKNKLQQMMTSVLMLYTAEYIGKALCISGNGVRNIASGATLGGVLTGKSKQRADKYIEKLLELHSIAVKDGVPEEGRRRKAYSPRGNNAKVVTKRRSYKKAKPSAYAVEAGKHLESIIKQLRRYFTLKEIAAELETDYTIISKWVNGKSLSIRLGNSYKLKRMNTIALAEKMLAEVETNDREANPLVLPNTEPKLPESAKERLVAYAKPFEFKREAIDEETKPKPKTIKEVFRVEALINYVGLMTPDDSMLTLPATMVSFRRGKDGAVSIIITNG